MLLVCDVPAEKNGGKNERKKGWGKEEGAEDCKVRGPDAFLRAGARCCRLPC